MTTECVRVLHVFGSLDRGGAESMIMNLYRKIDRHRVQFDFVVNESSSSYAYESEIRKLGGRIFYLPALSLKNITRYLNGWRALLAAHPEWKIVHIHHTSSASVSIPVAKKLGRITIAHSHTAGSDGSLKSRFKIASRYPVRYLADYLFSCSATAARWMFGGHETRTHILNNAIDTGGFLPDPQVGNRVRKEVGLDSKRKIVGHIGRFVEVKNHTCILEVLYEMVKQDPLVYMILIGEGPLKSSMMGRAESQGLAGHLLFTGVRSDIADLMQSMDAFIFPSLHEGLPVTLVEAQASGLPCLVSDTVSDEVKLTECVEFMSLDTPAHVWAQRLLDMAAQRQRFDTQQALTTAGYDVKDNARWLQHFYLDLMGSA